MLRKRKHQIHKENKKLSERFKDVRCFIKEHTRDFCDKTSIHGLRYVTEENAHWAQSIMWLSFILAGVVFCLILMFLVWSRFDSNPTVTAVDTVNFPIYKVPFPAVTICDANKVNRSKTKKIVDLLTSTNFTEEYIEEFLKSLNTLTISRFYVNNKNYEDIFEVLYKNQYTVESIMLEVSLECDELINMCYLVSIKLECGDLFKKIKTSEGFCCSFNYFHSNETFDRSDINLRNSTFKDEMFYSGGAGISTGLSVLVIINGSEYMSSSRSIPSALTLAHKNMDLPDMKQQSTVILKGQNILFPIESIVVDATNDVKSLPFEKRDCYFDGEASLSIGAYGYENCMVECKMDTILINCGCIPYYFNIKYYTVKAQFTSQNKSMRICEIADAKCIMKILPALNSVINPYDNIGDSKNESASMKEMDCDCVQTCDLNDYTYSVSSGFYIIDKDIVQNEESLILSVYNSEFTCIKYTQSNILTWDGLLASFGGIFGLCFGGSVLSLLEIVYHFTVRMYFSFYEFMDKKSPQHFKKPQSKWEEYINHSNRIQEDEIFTKKNKKQPKKMRSKKIIVKTFKP